jgi:release factor glutamine methyltransferase
MMTPVLTVPLTPETSLADAVPIIANLLATAGITAPVREARVLLTRTLALDPGALIATPEASIGPGVFRLVEVVHRRAAREPLSRILGVRGFYGLDFEITPATLDPRPETETLVETVLDWVANVLGEGASVRILDLGTGSGCILIALLHRLPFATGVGVDLSAEAVSVAQRNADRLGVAARAAFAVADAFPAARTGLAWAGPPFDIIVTNPPYIPTAAIAALEPEVRAHDPLSALDGGVDGLVCHRRLARDLSGLLRPGGLAAVEVGHDQAAAVAALLTTAHPAARVWTVSDLAGVARCVALSTHG